MGIRDMLYIENGEKRDIKRGDLLMAEPLLKEQFFDRAVILVIDSAPDNSVMGLALNKETNIKLSDIMEGDESLACIPVYCGGPVDTNRLFMLHTLGDQLGKSLEICHGLFIGGDIGTVVSYIEDGGAVEGKIRFILGYSGWSTDQLKEEIEKHVWAISASAIMNNTQLLQGSDIIFWRDAVSLLGPKYRSWLLVPTDPTYN